MISFLKSIIIINVNNPKGRDILKKKKDKNSAYSILSHWYNAKSLIVFQCLILGVFVGLVVVLYRFLLDFSVKIIDKYVFSNPYSLIDYLRIIIFLLLSGITVKKIVKFEPLSSGSGIPQVKGFLFRLIKMPWKNILISKFIGGVLATGSGLSVGREGPSIQIGAAIGRGFSNVFKRNKHEEKYLVTGGASAGLAAAFNAPLAGVVFALEELHKSFSPLIVITALATTVSAEFISEKFYGSHPVLSFNIVKILPLDYYYSIIILGIILGFAGIIYNRLIVKAIDFYSGNFLIDKKYKLYAFYIIAGAAVIYFPEITRGGHHLIEPIVDLHFGIRFLIIVLVSKFIFSIFSYGTGSPGGIFLPILVLGAIIGSIYGQFLNQFLNLEAIYIQNMVIFSMAGLLTSIVRAPITSSILICEMTGSFTHFLPITIVVILSHLIPEFFKCPPIYETFLERATKNTDLRYQHDEKAKVLLEKTVVLHSLADDVKISDIKWPRKCLIVNISRENKEHIPSGDFVLRAADILTFITDESIAGDVKEKLGYITDYSILEKM